MRPETRESMEMLFSARWNVPKAAANCNLTNKEMKITFNEYCTLHPQWQRFVVPKLLEVFPNCQFFISTHSPNIITHVQPESLHFMEQTEMGIKVHPVQESYGKNVDRILEDLMGLETTRPKEIAEALKDIYEQISQNQLEAAKKKINDLRAKIQDDPELIKAEVIIRRKEIIGK